RPRAGDRAGRAHPRDAIRVLGRRAIARDAPDRARVARLSLPQPRAAPGRTADGEGGADRWGGVPRRAQGNCSYVPFAAMQLSLHRNGRWRRTIFPQPALARALRCRSRSAGRRDWPPLRPQGLVDAAGLTGQTVAPAALSAAACRAAHSLAVPGTYPQGPSRMRA